MEGLGGSFAGVQVRVESAHQAGRRSNADRPKAGDDVLRAGTQDGPSEPDESFAGHVLRTGTLASGQSHQVGVQL